MLADCIGQRWLRRIKAVKSSKPALGVLLPIDGKLSNRVSNRKAVGYPLAFITFRPWEPYQCRVIIRKHLKVTTGKGSILKMDA